VPPGCRLTICLPHDQDRHLLLRFRFRLTDED
jgi:hypothetical protein